MEHRRNNTLLAHFISYYHAEYLSCLSNMPYICVQDIYFIHNWVFIFSKPGIMQNMESIAHWCTSRNVLHKKNDGICKWHMALTWGILVFRSDSNSVVHVFTWLVGSVTRLLVSTWCFFFWGNYREPRPPKNSVIMSEEMNKHVFTQSSTWNSSLLTTIKTHKKQFLTDPKKWDHVTGNTSFSQPKKNPQLRMFSRYREWHTCLLTWHKDTWKMTAYSRIN